LFRSNCQSQPLPIRKVPGQGSLAYSKTILTLPKLLQIFEQSGILTMTQRLIHRFIQSIPVPGSFADLAILEELAELRSRRHEFDKKSNSS
jgi:hypothetical protein